MLFSAFVKRISGGRKVIGLAICSLAIPGALVLTLRSNQSAPIKVETFRVVRRDLSVTVTEHGVLESRNNVEIASKVRGSSKITWAIENGTEVQAGDELIRFDTKQVEEEISDRTTDVHLATAILEQTRTEAIEAEGAVSAYLNGRYQIELSSLESNREVTQRNYQTSIEVLSRTEQLYRQGIITALEVEANRYSVEQAELDLKIIEENINILNNYTKPMELETLNGNVTATQSRLIGRTEGLALEEYRRDLALEQLENCVIRADRSGLVIYASTASWQDAPDIQVGGTVFKDQVLMLMPDLNDMQVRIGIHESLIDRILEGQNARVVLPSRELDGTVTEIALFANPRDASGSTSSESVEYSTTIQLPQTDDLKPGMSAEVVVTIAHHDDVLVIPWNAVVEINDTHFCWIYEAGRYQRRELTLGDGNDRYVIISSGLEENDDVVLHPLEFLPDAQAATMPSTTHTISRGDLVQTVTERGILESANNTEVKVDVRGASNILWVVEHGAFVEEGDVLVRLDNKSIEDFISERTKYAHLSNDAAVGATAHAARAKINISAYEFGRSVTERMRLERELALAEARLRTSRNQLAHELEMDQLGYSSELKVKEKELRVNQAELDVEVKIAELEILEHLTKPQELIGLRGFWRSAEAARQAHQEVLRIDNIRIQLAREELERCVIRAERSGPVVYASTAAWERAPDVAVGATVHDDQVLLLIPDLSQMQVRVAIHESNVERMRPGLSAQVTLANHSLAGEVAKVSSVTNASGWWNGFKVNYDAVVELPFAEGLKPGATAEVEIEVARYEDEVLIPLRFLAEFQNGTGCYVQANGNTTRRMLRLGSYNDEYAIVESGLRVGEVVVQPE